MKQTSRKIINQQTGQNTENKYYFVIGPRGNSQTSFNTHTRVFASESFHKIIMQNYISSKTEKVSKI
jgi:hypothetical protein